MLERILRAIGRGLRTAGLAVLHLLWEAIVEIVRGLARGTSDIIRRMMPWALGAGAVWGLLVFAPELFQLLLVLGIMVYGLKIMVRGLLPAPKRKKK